MRKSRAQNYAPIGQLTRITSSSTGARGVEILAQHLGSAVVALRRDIAMGDARRPIGPITRNLAPLSDCYIYLSFTVPGLILFWSECNMFIVLARDSCSTSDSTRILSDEIQVRPLSLLNELAQCI